MQILNYVLLGLMALTIVGAGVFGERFLGLPYRTRLAIGLGAALVFGGWIVGMNVL